MGMYIVAKFGADWLIFVDARVLRKLWMDGHRQTVSYHNSSLSTPCSCEPTILTLNILEEIENTYVVLSYIKNI